MKTLICIDRDGTLIYDSKEHLFLGSKEGWQKEVKILPGVPEGLKLLNDLDDVHVYMITNQSGIAVKELPELTEKKAHEVCQYVLEQINQDGLFIEDFYVCPHAPKNYFVTHPEFTPNEMVCDCECIKPRLGMVLSALEEEGIDCGHANIYVIGDRVSDAMTGVNAGGHGVLVPFENQPGEEAKVASDKIYVAKGFVDGCKYIVDKER